MPNLQPNSTIYPLNLSAKSDIFKEDITGGNNMNDNEEKVRTQIGIYNLPRNAAHPDDKVLKIFTKLKNKAKQMETKSQSPALFESGQGQPIRDLEPNLQDLQASAMNSYRLRSDVIKTDHGFEVV